MATSSTAKDPDRQPGPAHDAAASRGLPLRGAADSITLCFGCTAVVRLTPEQAVIAEAELIALDVVSVALCRRCREAVP